MLPERSRERIRHLERVAGGYAAHQLRKQASAAAVKHRRETLCSRKAAAEFMEGAYVGLLVNYCARFTQGNSIL